MLLTIEPTPEMYEASINGSPVPVRIWFGKTDKGTKVEVYVLSVVPDVDDVEQFKSELPRFMVPNRKLYAIGDHPRDESGDQ